MTPPTAWAHLPFFREVWPGIARQLAAAPFLPGPAPLFRALALTPPHAVRVILLGQDPYPTPGHADGLAFSVAQGAKLPRSLANIFAEMEADIGARPGCGNLDHWARQGVLLLNTALSVPPGAAAGHARIGWARLAREAMAEAQRHGPVAFLLWGNHAQSAAAGLPRDCDLVLASAHPSPLSARRGFFGARPFSRVNGWLASHRPPAIDWTGAATPALAHQVQPA